MLFEKPVVHRALRVHHFGRVALVRGKNFSWGVSALVLAKILGEVIEQGGDLFDF